MCSSKIRQLIAAIELDALFSTRQFLAEGKRAAVDQALHRMVKSGEIIRLTPGLFIKAGSKWPSLAAIAAAKARAFARDIVEHAGNLAARLELVDDVPEITYDIAGSTSAFHCGERAIRLKTNARRKMRLDRTEFGAVVRAVWFKGEKHFDDFCLDSLYNAMRTFDRRLLPSLSALMPAWINDYLVA
jgi:hypothetical protein